MGPADDEPCPCGSARVTAECHFNPQTHRWQLPAFTPLLSGARTESSVSGCFAAFTNDCQGTLSNEHWLSNGILVEAGDGKVVRIGGLPWQGEGRIDELPPRRLGSNILCERHNHALSPLDAVAGNAFRVLDKFFLDQISREDIGGNELDLLSGEHLERWLLKMMWGATAAFPTVPRLRANIDQTILADYLFRDGQRPADWGLYVKGLRTGRPSDPGQSLTVGLENIDGEMWGGSVRIGGVELYFSFGRLTGGGGATVAYRPSALFLDRTGTENCKVVALSWDRDTATVAKAVRIGFDPEPSGH
ncbi:hypothetical protein [Mycobacterium sp.]|uniref:hypothetical protein n=1 Tax=Mycobacterium sp. TaxID=1785 RepID=UPI003F9452DC